MVDSYIPLLLQDKQMLLRNTVTRVLERSIRTRDMIEAVFTTRRISSALEKVSASRHACAIYAATMRYTRQDYSVAASI